MLFGSSARVSELIDATLEGVIKGKRLTVRERQELHENHARNASGWIEPVVGVVDSAPAQTAGRAFARHLICCDQEAETPFVATVRDKAEIGAARQRGTTLNVFVAGVGRFVCSRFVPCSASTRTPVMPV